MSVKGLSSPSPHRSEGRARSVSGLNVSHKSLTSASDDVDFLAESKAYDAVECFGNIQDLLASPLASSSRANETDFLSETQYRLNDILSELENDMAVVETKPRLKGKNAFRHRVRAMIIAKRFCATAVEECINLSVHDAGRYMQYLRVHHTEVRTAAKLLPPLANFLRQNVAAIDEVARADGVHILYEIIQHFVEVAVPQSDTERANIRGVATSASSCMLLVVQRVGPYTLKTENVRGLCRMSSACPSLLFVVRLCTSSLTSALFDPATVQALACAPAAGSFGSTGPALSKIVSVLCINQAEVLPTSVKGIALPLLGLTGRLLKQGFAEDVAESMEDCLAALEVVADPELVAPMQALSEEDFVGPLTTVVRALVYVAAQDDIERAKRYVGMLGQLLGDDCGESWRKCGLAAVFAETASFGSLFHGPRHDLGRKLCLKLCKQSLKSEELQPLLRSSLTQFLQCTIPKQPKEMEEGCATFVQCLIANPFWKAGEFLALFTALQSVLAPVSQTSVSLLSGPKTFSSVRNEVALNIFRQIQEATFAAGGWTFAVSTMHEEPNGFATIMKTFEPLLDIVQSPQGTSEDIDAFAKLHSAVCDVYLTTSSTSDAEVATLVNLLKRANSDMRLRLLVDIRDATTQIGLIISPTLAQSMCETLKADPCTLPLLCDMFLGISTAAAAPTSPLPPSCESSGFITLASTLVMLALPSKDAPSGPHHSSIMRFITETCIKWQSALALYQKRNTFEDICELFTRKVTATNYEDELVDCTVACVAAFAEKDISSIERIPSAITTEDLMEYCANALKRNHISTVDRDRILNLRTKLADSHRSNFAEKIVHDLIAKHTAEKTELVASTKRRIDALETSLKQTAEKYEREERKNAELQEQLKFASSTLAASGKTQSPVNTTSSPTPKEEELLAKLAAVNVELVMLRKVKLDARGASSVGKPNPLQTSQVEREAILHARVSAETATLNQQLKAKDKTILKLRSELANFTLIQDRQPKHSDTAFLNSSKPTTCEGCAKLKRKIKELETDVQHLQTQNQDLRSIVEMMDDSQGSEGVSLKRNVAEFIARQAEFESHRNSVQLELDEAAATVTEVTQRMRELLVELQAARVAADENRYAQTELKAVRAQKHLLEKDLHELSLPTVSPHDVEERRNLQQRRAMDEIKRLEDMRNQFQAEAFEAKRKAGVLEMIAQNDHHGLRWAMRKIARLEDEYGHAKRDLAKLREGLSVERYRLRMGKRNAVEVVTDLRAKVTADHVAHEAVILELRNKLQEYETTMIQREVTISQLRSKLEQSEDKFHRRPSVGNGIGASSTNDEHVVDRSRSPSAERRPIHSATKKRFVQNFAMPKETPNPDLELPEFKQQQPGLKSYLNWARNAGAPPSAKRPSSVPLKRG